ncbi:MAG: FlgD immunoglobulin-like domain containing protein [Candidatus Eisenbacteria bacterium]
MRLGDSGRSAVIAAGVMIALMAGAASEALAVRDIEMTTVDYAGTMIYWFPVVFYTAIENTGTEGSTVDLHLEKNLPGGWASDMCIDGDCIPNDGFLYLAPGEVETVLVDVTVGGSQNMGLETMTATVRQEPSIVKSQTYAAFAQLPSFLLVDDDNGAGYETYLKTAIEAAGYKVRVWDADSLGRPGPIQLLSYWGVFWTTADGNAGYITSGDEQDMMTYLDSGGRLFLASMDLLSSRGGATTFTTNYLHAASWMNNTGAATVSGISGDPISDSMVLPLTAGPFSAGNTDNMTLNSPSDSIFVGATGISGLKVEESAHQLVFLSYPFEDVSTSAPDPDNQATLISRVIGWFDPPTAGVDSKPDLPQDELVLGQNSPNPFKTSTGISFAVPRGSRHTELVVYDVKGRVVKTLINGAPSAAGSRIAWDGRDDAGAPVASGVYFYKITADRASAIKKMVMLR